MKYIKLFESFGNADSIAEEIDNWIDSNEDYMSASSLEDKLKELLQIGSGSDDIKVTETLERSSEGNEYGEDWSTTIICAKYKGQDLMKVCVNSSKAYDFGKNSIMFRGLPSNKVVVTAGGFGVRFYFDKNLI